MYRIEKLTKAHNRTNFDCGKGSLNDFLFSYARQNAKRDYSQTYVAIDADGDPSMIKGYYSISCGAITFDELPDPGHIPREYPVPSILLARLARDKNAKGLGPLLLIDAYRNAVKIADIAGAHVFEVDAMDDEAKAFYERHDFLPLIDDPYHLFQNMKDIRKIIALLDAG